MAFSTVYGILKNTGFNLHDASQNILNNIRKARTLHVDETSMRLHGKNVWMWIFLDSDTNNVYHVIRDTTNEVKDELHAIIKGLNAKGNINSREKLVKRLQKKTRELAKRHGKDPPLEVFLRKLRNAVPDLFRFVIDSRIPPTNNAAEQGSA